MSQKEPPVLGQEQAPQYQAPPPYDDEIDLLELWRALLRGKWIIIGFTFVFSVASVFYALSLPNMYKSTAVLAPAEPSSGGGMAKLAGQFGGLAALAGLELGGSGSNKTLEAIEILKSWSFIEEFILEQDIAPEVFAAIGWNRNTDELIYDKHLYDPIKQEWKLVDVEGGAIGPNSWKLYERFSGFLSVVSDENKGFIKVSIEFYSPNISKQWIINLIDKINAKIRERDAKEAERNIAFLAEQIENTPLSNLQSVFYGVIEEQTKNLMLAKGADAYVFRIISEPRAAFVKSSPSRALICISIGLFGFFVGVAVALIRGFRSADARTVKKH